MYPVRSRVVALGNVAQEQAEQQFQDHVDNTKVPGSQITAGQIKQMEEAKRQQAAQARKEAADLTNVANSLAMNDPQFKKALADKKKAEAGVKKALENLRLARSAYEREKRSVPTIRSRTQAADDYYQGKIDKAQAKVAVAEKQVPIAKDRLKKAEHILGVAARAAMNRLSAFYPYKGYLIKPRLAPDNEWIKFDIQSNRTGQTLTTAERIHEAQAWIDREVSRQQERDIKIYDDARSQAVQISTKASKRLIEEQNRGIKAMIDQRRAEMTAEEQEAAKTRRNLLLAAAAAGGAILLIGGGS